jgi:hypothetical protein
MHFPLPAPQSHNQSPATYLRTLIKPAPAPIPIPLLTGAPHHRPWLAGSSGYIQDPLSIYALASLFNRHQQHFVKLFDADRPVFSSAFVQRGRAGVGSLGDRGRIAGRRIIIFQLRMKGIVMLEIQGATDLKSSTSPPSLPPLFR